jgi:hypothetical protein
MERRQPMSRRPRANAYVKPNASKVRGKLISIKPEPDGFGSNWEIAVDEAKDVDSLPNFARSHVGQIISVYVHPGLEYDLSEKDNLEAKVTYRGDERGGRFALIEDDVHKL